MRRPRFVSLKCLARAAPPPPRPSAPDDAELLHAATRLMQLALREGMPVEVYVPRCGRRFWAARVLEVDASGFRYAYVGAEHETGWCHRDAFLSRWRFPLADESEEGRRFTYSNVQHMLRHAPLFWDV
jgi:hypothetical protein